MISLLVLLSFGLLAQESAPKTAKEYRKSGNGELVVSLVAFAATIGFVSYMSTGNADLDSYGALFGASVVLAALGTVTMISANKNFKAARALEAQVGFVPLDNHPMTSASSLPVPGLGIKLRF